MDYNGLQIQQNISNSFCCEICDYITSKKYNLQTHLLSTKHKKNTKVYNNNAKSSKISKNVVSTEKSFFCNCGKEYKHRQGLWKHKKKCEKKENELNSDNFLELLKQNQDFKDLITEQNKIIMELAKNAGNNYNTNMNNCHNKTFNLQVFLNEKCKDALNISDFINSLNVSFADLENVGESGFVNGISKIFINGLKNLDVYKRPIHCSDLKRETMHIKEQNIWEKDNENKDRLKKVVRLIAHKNFAKINEWKEKYPECKNSDSKKNDQYLKLICESMGAKTKAEDENLYEKIIKNIAKEVTIDKSL